MRPHVSTRFVPSQAGNNHQLPTDAVRQSEVHCADLVAAQVKGMSLNQWASQALREAAHI